MSGIEEESSLDEETIGLMLMHEIHDLMGSMYREKILDKIEERTGTRDESLVDQVELEYLKSRIPVDEHDTAAKMQQENPALFRENLTMFMLTEGVKRSGS